MCRMDLLENRMKNGGEGIIVVSNNTFAIVRIKKCSQI